jgi:SAM-dependent methyltransferase
MNQIFGPVYAGAYDSLYGDKDYAGECDVIERLFRRYASHPVSTVLDLGSGTGNHAYPMANRGYEVVGVERSLSMLSVARSKLANAGAKQTPLFEQADVRTVDLGRQFDAAIMMFAVLGYQFENSDVLAALKTARRHLRAGSLFLFDVWYGPAVLHERPSSRVKLTPNHQGKILRVVSSELDVSHHLCRVTYHVWSFSTDKIISETEETHSMRYFFPLELQLFMECADFTLIRLGAFPDFDKEPDITTWNVLGVARAI